MELIKKINEDAVGAGDVGASAMPLFAQFVRREQPAGKSIPKPIVIKYGKSAVKKKAKPAKKEPFTTLGLKEAVAHFYENINGEDAEAVAPDFDASEVTAKLKSLEQRDSEDFRDTVAFGLEDDDGNVVRVRIKHDQAPEFEKALQAFMSDANEDEELPEIAELLFKLKDQFDIVDVEWPEIEEDEEEGQVLDNGEMPQGDDAGLAGDPGLEGDGLGDAPPAEPAVTDLLTQVIDMMKADADARKADARAREAEAKNREAEAAISQAQNRVKHEEELLDMDTYNKNKKEQEKESKRLAQLAQWRREVGDGEEGESDDDFGLGQAIRGGGEENEEVHGRRPTQMKPQSGRKTLGGRVHPHDVAKFILNRMR